MTAHSQLWTTGPCQIAVGSGTGGAMEFLGYSERGVTVRENAFFKPIHTDPTGPEMAADQMFLGVAIVVSCTLVSFDFAVLQRVRKRFQRSGGTQGALEANVIGTLINTEGLTMPAMFKFPYSSKTPYNGMDSGIRILDSYVMGDMGFEAGTTEMKPTLVFGSVPSFNTSTLTGTVWDTNVSGFPSLD